MTKITIESIIQAPVNQVWEAYTEVESVKQWNHASDDWHCPKAENNLRPGGKFVYTMASKDGKESFDFGGVYNEIHLDEKLVYTLDDGRKVDITFEELEIGITRIVVNFEAEDQNSVDMQKRGWGAILNNFRDFVEAQDPEMYVV